MNSTDKLLYVGLVTINGRTPNQFRCKLLLDRVPRYSTVSCAQPKGNRRVTEEEENDITILDTTEIQLRGTLYLPVRGNVIQVKIGAEEDIVADEPVTETEPVNIVELYSDNQETSETSSSELE